MIKIIVVILMFLVGGLVGYLIFNDHNLDFEKLSLEEMHKRIVEERDYAIAQASVNGLYRCCISPVCTMCYMEANQWNNHKAGTCACDDFIARGEEPCPQCARGSITDTGSSCQIDSDSCEQDLINNK